MRRGLQQAGGVELQLGGVSDGVNRLEARWKGPRTSQKTKLLGRKRRVPESLS